MTKMQIEYLGELRNRCTHPSGAIIETDAPLEIMGKAQNFSPTDLFVISLGSCMMTLIAIRAQKIGIDLQKMSAEVEKQMVNDPKRRIGKVTIRLRCPFTPNFEQQKELEQAAFDCPVHLSLHPNVKVEFDFIWGL